MIYVDKIMTRDEPLDRDHDVAVVSRFACHVAQLNGATYDTLYEELAVRDRKLTEQFDKRVVSRILRAHKLFGFNRDYRPLPERLTFDRLNDRYRPYREEVALIFGALDVQGHYETRHIWGYENADLDLCARLTSALEFYWMLAWPRNRDSLARSWRAFHGFNPFGMYSRHAMGCVIPHQNCGADWEPCDFDLRSDDLGYNTRFVSLHGRTWLLPKDKGAPILRFEVPAWHSTFNTLNLPVETHNEQPIDDGRYAGDRRPEHSA